MRLIYKNLDETINNKLQILNAEKGENVRRDLDDNIAL